MYEYLTGLKGQLICVRELHDSCGCHQCRAARVKSDTPVKTHKESEPATVLQTAKG